MTMWTDKESRKRKMEIHERDQEQSSSSHNKKRHKEFNLHSPKESYLNPHSVLGIGRCKIGTLPTRERQGARTIEQIESNMFSQARMKIEQLNSKTSGKSNSLSPSKGQKPQSLSVSKTYSETDWSNQKRREKKKKRRSVEKIDHASETVGSKFGNYKPNEFERLKGCGLTSKGRATISECCVDKVQDKATGKKVSEGQVSSRIQDRISHKMLAQCEDGTGCLNKERIRQSNKKEKEKDGRQLWQELESFPHQSKIFHQKQLHGKYPQMLSFDNKLNKHVKSRTKLLENYSKLETELACTYKGAKVSEKPKSTVKSKVKSKKKIEFKRSSSGLLEASSCSDISAIKNVSSSGTSTGTRCEVVENVNSCNVGVSQVPSKRKEKKLQKQSCGTNMTQGKPMRNTKLKRHQSSSNVCQRNKLLKQYGTSISERTFACNTNLFKQSVRGKPMRNTNLKRNQSSPETCQRNKLSKQNGTSISERKLACNTKPSETSAHIDEIVESGEVDFEQKLMKQVLEVMTQSFDDEGSYCPGSSEDDCHNSTSVEDSDNGTCELDGQPNMREMLYSLRGLSENTNRTDHRISATKKGDQKSILCQEQETLHKVRDRFNVNREQYGYIIHTDSEISSPERRMYKRNNSKCTSKKKHILQDGTGSDEHKFLSGNELDSNWNLKKTQNVTVGSSVEFDEPEYERTAYSPVKMKQMKMSEMLNSLQGLRGKSRVHLPDGSTDHVQKSGCQEAWMNKVTPSQDMDTQPMGTVGHENKNDISSDMFSTEDVIGSSDCSSFGTSCTENTVNRKPADSIDPRIVVLGTIKCLDKDDLPSDILTTEQIMDSLENSIFRTNRADNVLPDKSNNECVGKGKSRALKLQPEKPLQPNNAIGNRRRHKPVFDHFATDLSEIKGTSQLPSEMSLVEEIEASLENSIFRTCDNSVVSNLSDIIKGEEGCDSSQSEQEHLIMGNSVDRENENVSHIGIETVTEAPKPVLKEKQKRYATPYTSSPFCTGNRNRYFAAINSGGCEISQRENSDILSHEYNMDNVENSIFKTCDGSPVFDPSDVHEKGDKTRASPARSEKVLGNKIKKVTDSHINRLGGNMKINDHNTHCLNEKMGKQNENVCTCKKCEKCANFRNNNRTKNDSDGIDCSVAEAKQLKGTSDVSNTSSEDGSCTSPYKIYNQEKDGMQKKKSSVKEMADTVDCSKNSSDSDLPYIKEDCNRKVWSLKKSLEALRTKDIQNGRNQRQVTWAGDPRKSECSIERNNHNLKSSPVEIPVDQGICHKGQHLASCDNEEVTEVNDTLSVAGLFGTHSGSVLYSVEENNENQLNEKLPEVAVLGRIFRLNGKVYIEKYASSREMNEKFDEEVNQSVEGSVCLISSSGDENKNDISDDEIQEVEYVSGNFDNSQKDEAINSQKDEAIISQNDEAINSQKDEAIISQNGEAINSQNDEAINSQNDEAIISQNDGAINSQNDEAINSQNDEAVNSVSVSNKNAVKSNSRKCSVSCTEMVENMKPGDCAKVGYNRNTRKCSVSCTEMVENVKPGDRAEVGYNRNMNNRRVGSKCSISVCESAMHGNSSTIISTSSTLMPESETCSVENLNSQRTGIDSVKNYTCEEVELDTNITIPDFTSDTSSASVSCERVQKRTKVKAFPDKRVQIMEKNQEQAAGETSERHEETGKCVSESSSDENTGAGEHAGHSDANLAVVNDVAGDTNRQRENRRSDMDIPEQIIVAHVADMLHEHNAIGNSFNKALMEKCQGCIKVGKWSPEEEQQLKDNWKNVLKSYKYNDPLPLFSRCRKTEKIQMIKNNKFWIQIGKNIVRPLPSIYKKCQRLLDKGELIRQRTDCSGNIEERSPALDVTSEPAVKTHPTCESSDKRPKPKRTTLLCSECSYKTLNRRKFQQHLDDVHTKSIACETCGTLFQNKNEHEGHFQEYLTKYISGRNSTRNLERINHTSHSLHDQGERVNQRKKENPVGEDSCSDKKSMIVKPAKPRPELHCSSCPYMTHSARNLRQHTARVHDCETDDADKMLIQSNKDPTTHTQTDPVGSIPCDECSDSFSSKTELLHHILTVHGAGKHKFTCPQCDHGFNFRPHHIGDRDGPVKNATFECHKCPATFRYSSNRNRHETICKGIISMLNCSKCGRLFRYTGEAARGQVSEGRHCSKCHKWFGRKSGRKRHEKTCKGPPTQCEIKCSKCHISFTNNWNRIRHEKKCTGTSI